MSVNINNHMQQHEFNLSLCSNTSQTTTTPQMTDSPTTAKTKRQTKSCYRNDPYVAPGRVFFAEEPHGVEAEHAPVGTCHPGLWGRVGFVPYPQEPFERMGPAVGPEDGEPVRVFIGQLPYFVTEMQLGWLCHTFGAGHAVEAPERIMKRQATGERLPTGCVHAYTSVRAVEEMARGMHKRMLVDDTGVWHARTVEEFDVLSAYVGAMKKDKTLRVPNRPYDTVVVQMATSTFMPANPMPLSAVPAGRPPRASLTPPRHTQHDFQLRQQFEAPPAYQQVATPPPAYEQAMLYGGAPEQQPWL